eukprot:CAMPEP_0206612890 /NCGR_PEP_ID=MMETSP0325_2-20121206/56312_1 /ASSEMBLY_ACC=CAM_ASM_000347 /TAXON_ID=2866 /ORGANISM="Crypthecodinium cohnii, Strain Seligo" /LENGTH=221 /DNA_ID=CAMNT_0054132775 /DNA_START=215 /DNA_END=877 /DNA_ORIENTATION=+
MSPLIGFITDTEGNFDYWKRSVDLSRVVQFSDEHPDQLQFRRSDDAGKEDIFVFGGDAFDQGPGDVRIAKALVNFKKKYPDRVILLVGNRDVNKIRLTAELGEDALDIPQPVPTYPRAPPHVEYRDFVQKVASQRGTTVDDENTRTNRLHWILEHTMSAKAAFESRRKELSILHKVPEAGISDEDVTQHFLDSVWQEDGIYLQYLQHGQVAALIGNTLFVH